MISEALIFIDLDLRTQKEVFEFLAELSVKQHFSVNQDAVFRGLNERENEGTTGMMDGFAIPHAKSDCIIYPAVVVIKLSKGIEWHSMDGQAIQFIFALFIPAAKRGAAHLKLLSQVAKMLMKKDFKDAFIASHSKAEVASLISQIMEEQ